MKKHKKTITLFLLIGFSILAFIFGPEISAEHPFFSWSDSGNGRAGLINPVFVIALAFSTATWMVIIDSEKSIKESEK